MAVPTRPPRTRASGGRTLMLLGVLLALAAGTIVIYIVSQATGPSSGSSVTVVVAKTNLQEGMILSVSTSDTKHVLISDAFTTESVPANLVPPNARPWVSQDDLNVYLADQVIVGQFYQGDILQQSDPRLVKVGTGAAGSLALLNPGRIKAGQVLFTMTLQGSSGKPLAVPGDYVDVLAVACNLQGSKNPQGCAAQTTVQDLYVYTVSDGQLVVVVDRHTAEELMLLSQTASKMEVVLRGAGDNATPVPGSPVNNGTLVSDFNF